MRTIMVYFNNLLQRCLPETKFFGLKRKCWRLAGAEIGDNVRICSSAKILGAGELVIGSNTWIGADVFISTSASVKIGGNCDIAPRVYIGDGTHKITPDKDRIADVEISEPIIIGNGCWLCANSKILPGVNIGEKCVIAAGAVVSKSCGNGILLAGVPAEIKKKFF